MQGRRGARVILGALSGYATVLLLSVATTLVVRALVPAAGELTPPAWFFVLDFGYSVAAMAAGGYAAARVGGGFAAAVVLAALTLILGVVSAAAGADPLHPMTYQWAVAIAGPVGILLGGRWAASR